MVCAPATNPRSQDDDCRWNSCWPRENPRMKRRTVVWGLTVVLLAACRPPAATPARPGDGRVASPPWLVTIVVDQLAAWMSDERWPALPSNGGFARLLRE